MAVVKMQATPSFYANFSKDSVFLSANTYEKNIVFKGYCSAHHDGKLCFLPNHRYHFILIGDIDELLQKQDALLFTYKHVDCPYTLFNYRPGGKNVCKSGQVFHNVQSAV